MTRKKGERFSRRRSQKALRTRRKNTRKKQRSKWKRNYPEIFKEVSYYPFFIRKDKKD